MHLSYSRISKHSQCPFSYKCQYIDGWKPVKEPANLKYGSAIHAGIERFLTQGEMPVDAFQEEWLKSKDLDLDYGSKESWDSLNQSGIALMELFQAEHMPRFGQVYAVEHKFFIPFSESYDFLGFMDCVAEVDGIWTIVDFKTASRSYDESQVLLDDQLTTYAMAARTLGIEVERVAFMTLIKTKVPKIEWHFATRSDEQIEEFKSKARFVADDIARGRYEKRSGMHCSWCSYLPICSGNEAAIQETLRQEAV
jgi:putative RecB family exonuclease